MKTTKRLYGANTVLYTSVTVMCPVPFPRLCFLLQCSVKLAACFGFGLVILQSSHGWNFFLLSHTVKYFLPLVCRYLLRRFEKCRFYFFGSLLCPSVLHSRLCPVLLLCRHASFFFYRFICLGRFGHTKRTQLVKIRLLWSTLCGMFLLLSSVFTFAAQSERVFCKNSFVFQSVVSFLVLMFHLMVASPFPVVATMMSVVLKKQYLGKKKEGNPLLFYSSFLFSF